MQDNTRLNGEIAFVTSACSRNTGAGVTTIGNGRADGRAWGKGTALQEDARLLLCPLKTGSF
jgi:hypothetical protein